MDLVFGKEKKKGEKCSTTITEYSVLLYVFPGAWRGKYCNWNIFYNKVLYKKYYNKHVMQKKKNIKIAIQQQTPKMYKKLKIITHFWNLSRNFKENNLATPCNKNKLTHAHWN